MDDSESSQSPPSVYHDTEEPRSSFIAVAAPDVTPINATNYEPPEFTAFPILQNNHVPHCIDITSPRLPDLLSSDNSFSPELDIDHGEPNAGAISTPIFTATEDFQSPNDLLEVSGDIPSLSNLDSSDAVFNSDDSVAAAQGSPGSITTGDLGALHNRIHQPQAFNPTLTSALLQEMGDPQFNQYTLNVPRGFKSLSPGLEVAPIGSGRLQSPPASVSGPEDLKNGTLFKGPENPPVDPSGRMSSSPDVATSNRLGYNHSHKSPRTLENLSTLRQGHRTPIAPSPSHQTEVHLLSTSLPGADEVLQSIEVPPDETQGRRTLVETSKTATALAVDAEEPDLSPLEYARKNGLSRNYLEMPGHILNLDDSHLPQFEIAADVNTNERLIFSKEAAQLLSSVIQEATDERWYDDQINKMIHFTRHRHSRLELPLLRSDNETNCKKFAKKEGFEITLKDVKLPLEMVDEANNGGMTFSHAQWNKGAEILESLQKERLEVTRDTLTYLQEISRDDWTEEDEKKLWAASTKKYKRVSATFIDSF
jgi:hypothetical protein